MSGHIFQSHNEFSCDINWLEGLPAGPAAAGVGSGWAAVALGAAGRGGAAVAAAGAGEVKEGQRLPSP